ncbi:hypothetical protein CALVIDRAFT_584211 [Calocera viscosa TUFC12733]|uniref:Uncharacterized protein n=1 Tax=Calocera viscosa (strain TUFC12733) TaxID=1330018 RepID=A0A167R4T2_CALVF|nr:hypothetical protein CALVIDRAFT_584211 [Calocera viscosa TUFC12733]
MPLTATMTSNLDNYVHLVNPARTRSREATMEAANVQHAQLMARAVRGEFNGSVGWPQSPLSERLVAARCDRPKYNWPMMSSDRFEAGLEAKKNLAQLQTMARWDASQHDPETARAWNWQYRVTLREIANLEHSIGVRPDKEPRGVQGQMPLELIQYISKSGDITESCNLVDWLAWQEHYSVCIPSLTIVVSLLIVHSHKGAVLADEMGLQPDPGTSASYHQTISSAQFWTRLFGFLKLQFEEEEDAAQALEDVLLASKSALSAGEIARIRETVGISGMGGKGL